MKRTLDDYKQAESDHTSVSAETCQIERMKLLNGLMIVGEYQQSLEQQYESRVRATETTQPMDTILNLSNGYIPPQKQMTQTKKLHVSQVYNDEEQEEEDECASKSDTRGQGHDEWYKNFRYFTSRLLQLGKETNDTLSSQLATTQKTTDLHALTIHHKMIIIKALLSAKS
eukprot:507448_1